MYFVFVYLLDDVLVDQRILLCCMKDTTPYSMLYAHSTSIRVLYAHAALVECCMTNNKTTCMPNWSAIVTIYIVNDTKSQWKQQVQKNIALLAGWSKSLQTRLEWWYMYLSFNTLQRCGLRHVLNLKFKERALAAELNKNKFVSMCKILGSTHTYNKSVSFLHAVWQVQHLKSSYSTRLHFIL